jgi:DNA-binding winged helix-turn-helix (wHTH) protein
MPKSQTPSHIVTRRLYTNPHDEVFLDGKMFCLNRIYNVGVKHCRKQLELLHKDERYIDLLVAFKNSTEEKIVTFGSVRVNITARTVEKGGKPVTLSLREFDLLAYLCENKNAAVSKEKIFSAVWGAFTEVEPSTLAVHIRWLREKLEDDPAEPKYIRTVRKVGYVLEVTDS